TDKGVLRKTSRGPEVQVHIRPETPLVENGPYLLSQLLGSLQREERDRAAIRHCPLRAQQGQRMAVASPLGELPQQGWVVDRQHLPQRRLDIERKVGLVGS